MCDRHEAGDTIAAIATPRGVGGIAIIRVSGRLSVEIVTRIARLRSRRRPPTVKNWGVQLADIVDPATGQVLDEAIIILMRGPHSYTREDVVEIHCHGGQVMAEKILDLVLKNGARHAAPGEFTMRAFLSGRINLDEAEAVLEVVTAQTEGALKQAGRRLKGELGRQVEDLDGRLRVIMAEIEVGNDYPEDWETGIGWVTSLREILRDIDSLLSGATLGVALSSGVDVCLVGRPNVGKSALFNSLLGQERALVTRIPGTTRDILRERVEWAGLPIVLLDTAGLRETGEVVEAMGVERAKEVAAAAEVVLYVLDDSVGLTGEDRYWLSRFRTRRLIAVVNKVDLGISRVDIGELEALSPVYVRVSGVTGEGIEDLRSEIVSLFTATEVETVLPGSARQVACLSRARGAIGRALSEIEEGWTEDVAVESLREAAAALAELTGKDVTEETLKEVFSRFCVGK